MISFGPASDRLAAWIAGFGVTDSVASWIAILVLVCAPTLCIVFPIAGVAQYFERKIAGIARAALG